MKRRSFLSVAAALAVAPFVGIAKAFDVAVPKYPVPSEPKYPADAWPKRRVVRLNADGSRSVVRMRDLKPGDKFQIDGGADCPKERIPYKVDWQKTVWVADGEPYRDENGNWTIRATG